jgi:hypothetical protein
MRLTTVGDSMSPRLDDAERQQLRDAAEELDALADQAEETLKWHVGELDRPRLGLCGAMREAGSDYREVASWRKPRPSKKQPRPHATAPVLLRADETIQRLATAKRHQPQWPPSLLGKVAAAEQVLGAALEQAEEEQADAGITDLLTGLRKIAGVCHAELDPARSKRFDRPYLPG